MSFLAKFRRQINRDDGKFFQVGNRPLGWIEAAGMLLATGALAAWQLQEVIGIGGLWSAIAGAGGLLLAVLGHARDEEDKG